MPQRQQQPGNPLNGNYPAKTYYRAELHPHSLGAIYWPTEHLELQLLATKSL
jgi:hypothetical protein